MKRRNTRESHFIIPFVVALLAFNLFAFTLLADNFAMPDHSILKECDYCHLDKAADWRDSRHNQSIRSKVQFDLNGSDCVDCHSYKLSVTAQNDDKNQAAGKKVHRNSCLACHVPGSDKNEHQLAKNVDELCEICHFQRDMLWGKNLRGLDDIRNFHSGVSCVNCHMNNGNHLMKVARPDDPTLGPDQLDTCTRCHQDDHMEARIEQIQEWQHDYELDIVPMIEKIAQIDAKLGTNSEALSEDTLSQYEDARHNVLLMKKDGSRAFHNYVMVLALKATAGGIIEEVLEILE